MFADLIKSLRKNWRLTYSMTRRELFDGYAGQVLGPVWAFIHPLMLAGVYIIIFGVVFQARIDLPGVPNNYPAYLMSGVFAWLSVVDSLNRSVRAISGNEALVKQIVFPAEILVFRAVLSALFTQAVATFIAISYIIITVGTLPLTTLILPVIFVFQAMFILGMSFFVATVGVFIKDSKDFIQIFSMFGIYMAPIVFLFDWLPSIVQYGVFANPFTHMVFVYQDILFFGYVRYYESWIIFPVISIVSLMFGIGFFRRFQHSFANLM